MAIRLVPLGGQAGHGMAIRLVPLGGQAGHCVAIRLVQLRGQAGCQSFVEMGCLARHTIQLQRAQEV